MKRRAWQRAPVAALLIAVVHAAAAAACDCSAPELPLCTGAVGAAPAWTAQVMGNAFALPQAALAGDKQVQALHNYHVFRQFEETRRNAPTNRLPLLEQALGKPVTQVRPTDFVDPQFQHRLAELVQRNGGLGALFEASPRMVYPAAKPPAAGRIPASMVHTPVTVAGNCIRPAGDPDWLPDANGRLHVSGGNFFPEVGRILSRRRDQDGIWTCAFVLLSRDWALTARHCVLDPATRRTWSDLSGQGVHAIRFFTAPEGEEPQRRLLDCFDDGLIGTNRCPLRRVRVTRIVPGATEPIAFLPNSDVPVDDLALLRLADVAALPVYPTLVSSLGSSTTVTFVGFGSTTAHDLYQGFELQVGWGNTGAIVPRPGFQTASMEYAWVPKAGPGMSSTCLGDSGGAVFAGFESGFCTCSPQKKQSHESRRLLGLISYVQPSEDGKPLTPENCKSASRAGALVPASYLAWICENAPDLVACKQ